MSEEKLSESLAAEPASPDLAAPEAAPEATPEAASETVLEETVVAATKGSGKARQLLGMERRTSRRNVHLENSPTADESHYLDPIDLGRCLRCCLVREIHLDS